MEKVADGFSATCLPRFFKGDQFFGINTAITLAQAQFSLEAAGILAGEFKHPVFFF